MSAKDVIAVLASCYKNRKNELIEHAAGRLELSSINLQGAKRIVQTLEENIKKLKEDEYFIIYNEVIMGKKGKWYQGYLSEASYYRHRKIAYRQFIRALTLC